MPPISKSALIPPSQRVEPYADIEEPFLDEIKAKAKVVQTRNKAKAIAEAKAEAKARAALQAYKKKASKLIIKGIKKHVKLQN